MKRMRRLVWFLAALALATVLAAVAIKRVEPFPRLRDLHPASLIVHPKASSSAPNIVAHLYIFPNAKRREVFAALRSELNLSGGYEALSAAEERGARTALESGDYFRSFTRIHVPTGQQEGAWFMSGKFASGLVDSALKSGDHRTFTPPPGPNCVVLFLHETTFVERLFGWTGLV